MTVHYRKYDNTPNRSACNNAGVITTNQPDMVTCNRCKQTRRYLRSKIKEVTTNVTGEVEQCVLQ